MPTPIKRRLADYGRVESNLMSIIAKKYGFEYPLSKMIKSIDELALANEWISLVVKEYDIIQPVGHKKAEEMFLNEFKKICNIGL